MVGRTDGRTSCGGSGLPSSVPLQEKSEAGERGREFEFGESILAWGSEREGELDMKGGAIPR